MSKGFITRFVRKWPLWAKKFLNFCNKVEEQGNRKLNINPDEIKNAKRFL